MWNIQGRKSKTKCLSDKVIEREKGVSQYPANFPLPPCGVSYTTSACTAMYIYRNMHRYTNIIAVYVYANFLRIYLYIHHPKAIRLSFDVSHSLLVYLCFLSGKPLSYSYCFRCCCVLLILLQHLYSCMLII